MDFTQLLTRANTGDSDARANLINAAYEDLRRIAAVHMNDEQANHTLSATALVHEVAIKLLGNAALPPSNRAQFLAYASKAMRNLLVDYARTRGRQKRGGNRNKVSLQDAFVASQEQSEDFLELNAALERLSEIDDRKANVVEMRYFGGLSIEETSAALEISPATVKRDWEVARTWLLKEIISEDS